MTPLPKRSAPYVYGILQLAITTAVAAAIATHQLTGFDAQFLARWGYAWLLAWLTMLPVVIVLAPVIQRTVEALTMSKAVAREQIQASRPASRWRAKTGNGKDRAARARPVRATMRKRVALLARHEENGAARSIVTPRSAENRGKNRVRFDFRRPAEDPGLEAPARMPNGGAAVRLPPPSEEDARALN